ncbi:MAG: HAD family hydrolase [Microcella pacifica]|uniref:HAD family hydrolase n=1 Tax=Microcella pacifica TaxID=2591847 RepID=UPI003314A9F3
MTAVDSAAIQVVLFDLDDTLMAHSRAVDLAIALTQRAAGGDFAAADKAAVQARWRELEELHYARYLSGELDYEGQRIHRARDLHAPYGIHLDDDAALAWFAEYLHGYRDSWTLFDDVLPALDALESAVPSIRFGIITNGDLAFQTDKLHRIDLWNRFDLTPVRRDGAVDDSGRRGRLIASGELGTTKPDPAIFAAAAAACDVPPESCAYLGDRVRTDAIGAHEAGMLGIWLDRGAHRNDTTSESHVDLPAGVPRIRSLRELPALLAP